MKLTSHRNGERNIFQLGSETPHFLTTQSQPFILISSCKMIPLVMSYDSLQSNLDTIWNIIQWLTFNPTHDSY